MSELAFAPLAQFADVVMGQSPGAELCNTEERGLPFLQGCAEFGARHPRADIYCFPPLRIAKAGAVLISVRAPVGTMNYTDQDYCIGRGLGSFKAKPGVSNTTFLKHAVELNASYLHRRSQGSTFAAVSTDDVKTVPIPVFKPAKQEKIANILGGIDTAIEKTEALIEKYQQIKAGLMHDLFTRGVLPNGQLRPPREQTPELYQKTAIGWIPKAWTVVRMVDLSADRKGSTTIGPFGSDLVAADYRLEGVPIVFVRDVKETGFEWNSETYISEKKAMRLRAHTVKSGEILATKMGLPPCISCLYPDWMPTGVITADMIRLSPDVANVDAFWLTTAINQDRVKRQVAAITAGVTRLKVTLADFRGILIAKPELGEQMLISQRLGAVQIKINAEIARVKKLQRQKLGLMQDLLTGKVEVKVEQDSVEAVNA
jgi:type I restriction enzyme S subunit